MTDYEDYLRPSRGPSFVQSAAHGIRRSLTRHSYRSHNAPSVNATTLSWVHSQQNIPGPPPTPPLPISPPTPVQRQRPLPNPHAQHHPVLHTVNPSEPLDREEERERMNDIRLAYQKAGPTKLRKAAPSTHNSNIKRTVIGGVVKSIRRIPRIMFGYGTSKGTLERKGTPGDGEGTSTSVTGIASGNSLPQYVSNPPTPIVAPIPSHPHHYTHQQMETQMVPILGSSPPPEVVRLDDVRRHCPSVRIMPPSINIARSETARFFPGTTTTDNPTDSSSSTATAERTTAMMSNHDHHTHISTPSVSRQISSNAPPGRLSYVGSEQIVRPTSFHGGSQAPPPIEIPTSITRMDTPASYLSYVSQPTTTLPLHVKRSSSQLRSLSNQSQQHQQHKPTSQHQSSFTPPIIDSSELIQSPISAHPQPTTDYLKMAVSPSHSLQQNTIALTNLTSGTHHSSSRITSFSHDPSFSKKPNLIARFFKTLYYMPWIAYERITVDYLPGKVGHVHGHALNRETSVRNETKMGGADRRKRQRDRDERRKKERKPRVSRGDGDGRLVSWYKGVSSHSKRTTAELDLLASDLGSPSLPTTNTSLGAPIGLGLEISPVDAAAALKTGKSADRERQQRERKENLERTSRSRQHHHHHRQDPLNRHRGRQRRRIGSMSDQENQHESFNQSPSPLIPAVYPFYYPPYPYPYPYTLTMPSPPGPPAQSQSQQDPSSLPSESPNDHTRSRNQRGPRSSRTNQGRPSLSQPPLLYNPGIPHPGYTAHGYQPMIAPSTTTMMAPQVYLLHPASHGQLQTQHLSSSGPIQNGGEVTAGDREGGGVGVGPEVPLDAVDSAQQ